MNNKNNTVEYRNISLLVRPIRVAILIPREDKYWKYVILNLFKFCSQVWGGSNFCIVPTDGKEIATVFWNILEAYDPDLVLSFRPTIRDIEYGAPLDFELVRQQLKEQLEKNFPSLDETFHQEFIERELLNRDRFSFGIENQLQQQIKHRLSPFHFNEYIVTEGITSHISVPFPLTELINIVTQGKVEKVYIVDSIDDVDSALYFYSNWGCYSSEFIAEIYNKGVTINRVPHQAKLSDLLRFCANKGFEKFDIYDRNLLQQKFGGADASWLPKEDITQFCPYETSLLKVGKYKTIETYVSDDPILLVVGDTVDDFCSYYSLSKIHDYVFWIPEVKQSTKLGEEEEFDCRTILSRAVIQSIVELMYRGRSRKTLHISSLSLTNDALEGTRKLINTLSFINQGFGQRVIIDSYPSSKGKSFFRLIEQNNYTSQYTEVFRNNRAVGRVPTPKPKNFSEVIPYEHRWITEIFIERYMPPQLHFLGKKIIDLHIEARVTKTGICYACPGIAYTGGDIDVTLVRPQINIVEPLEIFQEYFLDAGYSDVRLSDKGSYTHTTIEKFGSLEDLEIILRDKKNQEVLSLFKSQSTKQDNHGGEVIAANNRAYVNFQAIENIIGSQTHSVNLVDLLIRKGILFRGTMLYCSRCRNTDWYSLDELNQTFICRRCNHQQILQQKNWKDGREPIWFYKMDELVYQGIINNMILPLLTIAFLNKQAKKSFLYVPELLLRQNPSKPDREVDICCIVDGKIVIGECKIDKISKSLINKLKSFSNALPKTPDHLIFATLLDSISDEIVDHINSTIQIPHTILTKSDLLSID